MNSIEKLENAIMDVLIQVDEIERLDRITKEKVKDLISNLYNITGEAKEQQEINYSKLAEIMSNL